MLNVGGQAAHISYFLFLALNGMRLIWYGNFTTLPAFIVKFHALAAAAQATIRAVCAAVLTLAKLHLSGCGTHHNRGPGNFYTTAITIDYAFNSSHWYLLSKQ
jgi:hypothetical protein